MIVSITYHVDGTATVVAKSPFSQQDNTRTMKLTRDQYEGYLTGSLVIQEALPHLTKGEREFLMTGITDEEWNAAFKDDAVEGAEFDAAFTENPEE